MTLPRWLCALLGHRWGKWLLRPLWVAVPIRWARWERRCSRCQAADRRWFTVPSWSPAQPLRIEQYLDRPYTEHWTPPAPESLPKGTPRE